MTTRQNIQQLIMQLISAAKTIDSDDLIAQVSESLEKIGEEDRKGEPKYIVKRTVKRLSDAGAVVEDDSTGKLLLTLTEKGSQKLKRGSLSNHRGVLPMTWDGKWRMVILDFETDDKKARDAVRYILKKTNFVCIKPSVWVTPFDLGGFIADMKYNMHLTSEILFVTAESIDSDVERDLLDQFGIQRTN